LFLRTDRVCFKFPGRANQTPRSSAGKMGPPDGSSTPNVQVFAILGAIPDEFPFHPPACIFPPFGSPPNDPGETFPAAPEANF